MKVKLAVAALALAAFSPVASADITGKVNLDGKPPAAEVLDMSGVKECAAQHPDPVEKQTVVADDKGNLANVIVAIKKAEGQDLPGEIPKEPVVIDQKACMYEPHVLRVMAGQDFLVKNSDSFLHNVHALSEVNPPFNFGQPNVDPGKKIDSPKAAEYFHVKCDVHPWMGAYIGVFEHPYFAVTKDDGTYAIKTAGLADGDYTVTFYHEKYANDPAALAEMAVSVKDGKAEANHTFKAEAALAAPDLKQVILASGSGEKKKCEACCDTKKVARAGLTVKPADTKSAAAK